VIAGPGRYTIAKVLPLSGIPQKMKTFLACEEHASGPLRMDADKG